MQGCGEAALSYYIHAPAEKLTCHLLLPEPHPPQKDVVNLINL